MLVQEVVTDLSPAEVIRLARDFFTTLHDLMPKLRTALAPGAIVGRVVYGGAVGQLREEILVLPWSEIDSVPW